MADAATLYADAVAHLSAGRLDAAETAARRLLQAAPRNADAHNLLGLVLRRAGRGEEALNSFAQALALNPDLAPVHLNRGLTLTELGRPVAAEDSFARACALEPGSAPANFHLGVLLYRRCAFDQAVQHLAQVLAREPNHANTHAMLGMSLLQLGRFAAARRHLETAARLAPGVASIHDGLGTLAEDEGRPEAALSSFARALEIDPEFAPARFNRAVALLRRGELALGLPEYDWRWRLPADARAAEPRPFAQPRWQGEPPDGGGLLVWGEQGLGDEIRTAGMVDDLLRRGVRITLECDGRLAALFRRSLPEARIVARTTPPDAASAAPDLKWQIAADSLTALVRPSLAHFPGRPRYLAADAARRAGLRTRLEETAPGRLIVGVSWGSRNAQFAMGKSLPLAGWAPLLSRNDLHFVDLQYGDTAAERAAAERALGVRLTHLPDLDLTQDIDGLAALIAACDLVITVSNTTAHLAGALGVPTWVLLPFGHFQPWYWFAGRSDSPWYPSVRLYRQTTFGDWDAVIGRVAADLTAWRAGRG